MMSKHEMQKRRPRCCGAEDSFCARAAMRKLISLLMQTIYYTTLLALWQIVSAVINIRRHQSLPNFVFVRNNWASVSDSKYTYSKTLIGKEASLIIWALGVFQQTLVDEFINLGFG